MPEASTDVRVPGRRRGAAIAVRRLGCDNYRQFESCKAAYLRFALVYDQEEPLLVKQDAATDCTN